MRLPDDLQTVNHSVASRHAGMPLKGPGETDRGASQTSYVQGETEGDTHNIKCINISYVVNEQLVYRFLSLQRPPVYEVRPNIVNTRRLSIQLEKCRFCVLPKVEKTQFE